MENTPKKLIKKTAFVFKSQKNGHALSTDPTDTSIIIIRTETHIMPKR